MGRRNEHAKKTSHTSIIVIIILLLVIIIGGFFGYRYLNNKNTLDGLFFMGVTDNRQIGRAEYDIEYNSNCAHSIEYPTIAQNDIDNKILEKIEKLKKEFLDMYNEDITPVEQVEEVMQGITHYQYVSYESFVAPEHVMGLAFLESQTVGDTNVISEKAFTYNFDLKTGKELTNSDIFKDGYKEKLSESVKKYFDSKDEYKDVVDKNVILNKEENLNKIVLTNDKILVYFDKYEAFPGFLGIVKAEVSYDDMKDFIKINHEEKTKIPKATIGVKNPVQAEGNYNEVNEKVYAKTGVNIRKLDNTSSEKIGSLSAGSEITRIGIGDNGWSKVKYNNETAYISSTYITTEKPVEPIHTNVEITVDGTRNIDPAKPMVALTFDDGPNGKATPKILDTLEKYHAVATFFDLGTSMESYPKISQRAEAIGCEVESHTYAHKNLNTLSAQEINEDVAKAKNVYENVLGHSPSLIRPPYGNANSTVKATIPYAMINWDIDTLDWKSRNADSIMSEIHKYSDYNGRVILMHSIYTSTAEAVERLVPELIEKGYQLVTISEMAKYKGKQLQTGTLYYNFR